MLDAVFFDLYETLITEFDPKWTPQPTTAERLGVDQQAFRAAWQEAQPGRFTGEFPDYPSALRYVCDVIGEEPDEAVLQQLIQEKVALKERPLLDVEDVILEMLRGLRAAGLKVGLISNCAPGEVAAWERSPLASLIDRPVFSYEAGLMKPAAEIYPWHVGSWTLIRAARRSSVMVAAMSCPAPPTPDYVPSGHRGSSTVGRSGVRLGTSTSAPGSGRG